MTLTISTNEPIIIALDVTASMHTQDAPQTVDNNPAPFVTRLDYAVFRLNSLGAQLPKDASTTIVTFGADVYEYLEPVGSVHAGITAGAATSNLGKVLEWMLTEKLQGAARAQLLVITDGAPDDAARFEAWQLYNAQVRNNALAIHILTLGEPDWSNVTLPRGDRHSFGALADTTIMVHKPASTPPDRGDAARAKTQPPSVAPPDAVSEAKNALRDKPKPTRGAK